MKNIDIKKLSKEDKDKIREDLNKKRLKLEYFNKLKVYTFNSKEYYKLISNKDDYFILISDAKSLESFQKKIIMYIKYFNSVKSKTCLVKKDNNNTNILISKDLIRVQFVKYEYEKK